MKAKIVLSLLAAMLYGVSAAWGIELEADTLGTAGGTAQSSNYTISYTLGQTSVIGKSEGTSHTLNAGFWYCWNSLYGDANNDCIVDIADLIFVRSNLNAVINDDNWRADVNDDGVINILDLIFVRNRLGTSCD